MSDSSEGAPGLPMTTVPDTKSLRVGRLMNLEGVKKKLFECTDREKSRSFVELKRVSRQLEIASQRWGFDFANETPLPGAQRLSWQLVPASAVPSALRGAPVTIVTPKPSGPTQKSKMWSPERKTQRRITDFLKPRKRTHECGHGAHIRPPKVGTPCPDALQAPEVSTSASTSHQPKELP